MRHLIKDKTPSFLRTVIICSVDFTINMSSSQNEESETQTDIIKSRLLNVPSHGIRRIGRANTLLARLFWSYTFWIFTVLMCTFIFTAIRNFVRHPTKIHLSIKQYRDPALFPAITFCKNDYFEYKQLF